MATFKRIKTRESEFTESFPQPDWQKGYVFQSADYNGIEALGTTYAIDSATGRIHDWKSIERID